MDTYIITYRFLDDRSIRSEEEYDQIYNAFWAFLDKHTTIDDDGSTSTTYLKYDNEPEDLWKEIYDFFDEGGVVDKYRKDDIINLILIRNGEIIWAARWRKDGLRKLSQLTSFLTDVS